MRCEDALVRMLDAEPRDLGLGTGDLGEHLRSCKRCSAVAQTLSSETERLALALTSGAVAAAKYRKPDRSRPRVGLLVTKLAAAAVVVVLFRSFFGPVSVPPAMPTVRVVANSAPAIVPASKAAKPAPRIARALVRVPLPPATMPVPVRAVAVTASAQEVEPASPEIHIEPEAGTRATIWRGRNPNVTVVWLTK